MSFTLKFKKGSGLPIMAAYTPSGAKSSGDVVVVNGRPSVIHQSIAADVLGARAIAFGVYDGPADGAMSAGDDVYWDAGASKFTKTASGNPHFGFLTEDSTAAADGDIVSVFHVPVIDTGSEASVVAALTDNSGGAAADGTIGAVTAPSAITDNSGGVDPANNTIAVVTNPDLSAWNAGTDPTAAQATAIGAAFTAAKAAIAQLAAKQNVDRTAIIALTDAVKELATEINAILTSLKNAGLMKTA